MVGNLLESFGQLRLNEAVAGLPGSASRLAEHPPQLGKFSGVGFAQDIVQRGRRGRVEREAVARKFDRGQKQVSPGKPAELRVGQRQSADGARHADAEMGALALLGNEHVFGRRGRRRLAEIDRDRRSFSRRRHHHHVTAATDVARAGPGHGQGKRRRDGRVDGRSAASQRFDSDSRRQRVYAHHHPVSAANEITRADRQIAWLGRRALERRQRQNHDGSQCGDRARVSRSHLSAAPRVSDVEGARRADPRITTAAAHASTSVAAEATAETRNTSPHVPAGTIETWSSLITRKWL
jgi:hypothetical protein